MAPATAATRAPERPAARGRSRAGRFRVRPIFHADLERIGELREIARLSADPQSFALLRGVRGARWAVAEARGGHVAGMVGAVPLGETGLLCHLAVHPDRRREGLGTALSSWAVTYLRSWGVESVRLYSTPAAEGLYLALGFEPVARRSVFRLGGAASERTGTPWRLREEEAGHAAEGSRVRRLSLKDLPELCGLDRRSCGADRSALILATLKAYPGPSLVARDACDRISGYLLSSACASGTVRIGPFVAATPTVARVLLSRALLATPAGAPVEVVVPNPEVSLAREILQELGFHERRDRLRMELGETPAARGGVEQYGTNPYLAT